MDEKGQSLRPHIQHIPIQSKISDQTRAWNGNKKNSKKKTKNDVYWSRFHNNMNKHGEY